MCLFHTPLSAKVTPAQTHEATIDKNILLVVKYYQNFVIFVAVEIKEKEALAGQNTLKRRYWWCILDVPLWLLTYCDDPR